MLEKIGELRSQMQFSIGQVVLAILSVPRYRHLPIGDIAQLVIEPLLRERVAIAHAQPSDGRTMTKAGENTIAGVAIWATVSDAVDTLSITHNCADLLQRCGAKFLESPESVVIPCRAPDSNCTEGMRRSLWCRYASSLKGRSRQRQV